MPVWSQFSFQDAASPTMEEFVMFHDIVMVCLGFITVSVGGALGCAFSNGPFVSGLLDNQSLEWIWTALPGIVLFGVGLPSLSLLYMYDEMSNFDVGLKINGYQWYWSYEFPFLDGMSFDCFMIPSSESGLDQFRLLDTDVVLTLPIKSTIQLMASSKDVLHSWAIPSLGVKIDVIPGRINTLSFYSFRPGLFFGQCSEICGAHHSFMPIMVEMISTGDFSNWLDWMEEEL